MTELFRNSGELFFHFKKKKKVLTQPYLPNWYHPKKVLRKKVWVELYTPQLLPLGLYLPTYPLSLCRSQ